MVAMRVILLLAGIWFLSGCSSKSDYQLLQVDKKSTSFTKKISHRGIEYRILPQDRLDIVLYKNPDQSAVASLSELGQSVKKNGILVNSVGYVTLPLIGKTKVSGLTQTEAADRISRRYKHYLNTPSVYLEVMNKRLFVLGEVKKPGIVKIDKEKMTLFEALAFAGDLTDAAVRDNIIILSQGSKGTMTIRRVDLTSFDRMHYRSLLLRPNDVVYVQPNGWKEFKVNATDVTSIFEVIGKVLSPFATIKYLD